MEKIKEFKKVFLQKIIPCIISCVLAVGLACGSYAWYSSSVKFEFNKNFSGTTDVAYFAGGDGSINNPYIINNRYHIYNLAWLQYLGYFNLGSPVNNGRAQNYFKITANINMQGLAIPPIGTEKYKFIGNIEGGGYAVSNLVVSNDINSLTVRPSTIKGEIKDCSIVGFFGVLGASASELTQMKADGKTAIIDGNAVPVEVNNTAEPDATAGQAANYIYKKAISAQNFYLDKINVVSTTSETLIGIAAGYVAGNFKNVGVYRSAVSVEGRAQGLATALTDGGTAYGTIVSRYSIVGDYDEKNVTWESLPPGAGGEGPGFGDSIDMRTLARRINYMMAATTTSTVTENGVESYDKIASYYEGSTIVNSYFYNSGYNFLGGIRSRSDNYMFRYNSEKNLTAELFGGTYTTDKGTITKYTILPISVNMGLDDDKELETTTISGKDLYKIPKASQPFNNFSTKKTPQPKWALNEKYNSDASETPTTSNTGYIIGVSNKETDGTSGGILVNSRLRSETLNIKKAFKDNSYSNDKFALLYYDYAAVKESDKKFKYIKDKYNNVGGNYTGPDGETIELSGFADDAKKHYYDMRDNANFQRYMGIGDGNNNIYGLTFNKDSGFLPPDFDTETESAIKVKHNGKEYIAGGINFNVSNNGKGGVITAVVGTYAASGNQNSFSLYKVDYNEDKTIKSVVKVKKIEKAGTAVYDDAWYCKSAGVGPLEANKAYYIEIPVDDGDYIIGLGEKNQQALGYLMYLDIGANGGSGDGTTPVHYIKTVNFVNEAPSGTNPLTFAEYDVVVFFLDEPKSGAVKVVIYFKRKTENVAAGETKKATKVYYYPVPGSDAMGKITPTPSAYGENNQEAQNWN